MKRWQRLCLSVLAALLLSFCLGESSFIGTFLGNGHESHEIARYTEILHRDGGESAKTAALLRRG